MNKRKQPVYLSGAEFEHCRRVICTIIGKAENLERILDATGRRSAAQFRESLRIIKGLPSKGGAE